MDLSKHAFFEGKIVPLSDAKLSIATHAFLYGTSVFGGLRAYWNEEKQKLLAFRPYDHYRRLLRSSRLLSMQTEYDEEALIQLTLDVLRRDNWKQDIYMRPIFYKADLGIGVRLHDLKDEFCMFVIPMEKYLQNDTSAHVTVSSWRRIDDNMIPARGKVAGAYVNSALMKSDAVLSGFDEVLAMDGNGHLSEGSAMNIFIVRDGLMITPPVTDNILEGITRRSVMELARKELGLTIVERSIDRTEAYIAEEFFMTGTAAEVTAVTNVDHRPVGAGKMGPITTKLRELYSDAVRGRLAKYESWNVEV